MKMGLALVLLLAGGVAGAAADKPPAVAKKPVVKVATGNSPPRKPRLPQKAPPATPAVAGKALGLGCASGED